MIEVGVGGVILGETFIHEANCIDSDKGRTYDLQVFLVGFGDVDMVLFIGEALQHPDGANVVVRCRDVKRE
jgi:hypothetical protein